MEALEDKDIPAIAKAAMAEAHLTYAVPRYMDRPTCEAFIRTIKLPPQPSEDAARAARTFYDHRGQRPPSAAAPAATPRCTGTAANVARCSACSACSG